MKLSIRIEEASDPVLCENNLSLTHLPIRQCRINDVIYEIGKPCNAAGDGNNV
jgi:hypothetical protein